MKTIHTEYEVDGSLSSISEMAEYDDFGNITKFVDYGMGGVDAYFTTLEYGHFFKGLPTLMEVFSFDNSQDFLRKRIASYNDFGKLEEVKTQLDETNFNTVAMEYDDYGNLTKLTQPDNRDITHTQSFEVNLKYDSFVHTYPVEISNAFNETSTFVYDYFYGFPVLQTDVNGNSIRTRIDQRGRPIDIAGPYEYHGSGLPTTSWIIRKEYPGELPVEQQLFGSLPTDYRIAGAQGGFEAIVPGDPELQDAQHFARTRHRDPLTLGNEFVTVSIVDGFGQAIQLKKKHNKDGTNLVWQISGKEAKDALGRVIAQYLPTTQTFSAQATEYVTGTGGQPMTIAYDDKDRETEITQPGESSSMEIVYSIEDNLLKTEISNELDQTQSNFTDIRGRLHKTILNDEITTRFFYNAINEQIKVRDNAGNETRYRYDMAGRRIEEEHPDRGKTLFTYDNANRLIKKQTANDLEQSSNHSIEYAYDFGRLVEISYPQHPENNVTYEYGSTTGSYQGYNVGRLISQKDATGMQFFSYGKLGELTKQQRAVAVAGKTFYWFETEWEYDSWGRIKKITYPDKEEVTYYYDLAGQLQSVGTNLSGMLSMDIPKKIVENITYTELGERKSIVYGNGTINTYSYDTRRRLNNLKHTFSEFSMERQYQYDPLSNITGIFSVNATNPSSGVLGGPVEHFYEYDDYNRLVYADGYYVGPDDAVPNILKQAYSLDMEYDLLHNISEKNQVHQFGSVTSVNQTLPTDARHALTSYKLEYSGYGSSTYEHRQPHAPRRITEYPQEDYSGDPDDPRIKRKRIEYDANGNQLEIREEVKDPGSPQGYHLQSLRKNLWDAEDRLRAVDLDPEADADKPLVAIYTYDAGGERTIKYVPARIDARYSAKEAGSADRLEAMIYPSALLTAKILPIPEGGFKGNRQILKYTKHYYIGSERIASYLGTRQSVGMYCDQETMLIASLDAKVLEAGQALEDVFAHFDKTIDLDTPYLYGNSRNFVCGPTQLTEAFGAYWYHPDHLGSSSYITNLAGEINQHMEYLPFGELLVEEHLNSYNSPFKFNAKEFDAETGNYYYGARYYDPRLSIFLSIDPLTEQFPGWSPYHYVHNNPVNLIDPTGMSAEPPSTHTDESGSVIAVYDDGDDGVYVHSNGTTKAQIDQQRTDNKNTGGTGTNIGEIGGTLNVDGIYTNTLNKNIEEAKGIYNPFTFRNYVKTNGKWDLKNNKKTIYGLANDGKTQFSFNGELMESQDIGNHHFGAVALAYGLFPSEKFILEQAGEYQIKSGTSRPEWQIYKEETRYNYSKLGTPIPYKVKVMQPPYGDDPRDQKWIKSGFQYFKNK